MNNTIKEMKMLHNPPQPKRGEKSVESNLWVSDVTDTDMLNVLGGLDLAEPCYVSEDTKSALLSAMSKTDNLLAQISVTWKLVSVFCINILHYVNKESKIETPNMTQKYEILSMHVIFFHVDLYKGMLETVWKVFLKMVSQFLFIFCCTSSYSCFSACF